LPITRSYRGTLSETLSEALVELEHHNPDKE
jgi:hypothetical protein